MKEVAGIKAKVSISLFIYHITGFGLNYIYYGDAKRLVIIDADGSGTVVSDTKQEGELYYEEFIEMAKSLHLKMIEEQLTPFKRDVKCGLNN
jgi:hypothetical protein